MKLLLAFHPLLCILSTFTTAFEGDMSEAGLVPPIDGPDPGYIMAGCPDGLGNRLRVLAAFMHIAEWKYSNAQLVFDWDVNSACPGHFLNLFEPMHQVTFIANSSRYIFDKHAKVIYSQSSATLRWIMQANHVPKNRPGYLSWGDIERRMYSRFIPRRHFIEIAKAFVVKHSICNGSVIHMRMTDLDKRLHPAHRQSLQKHMWYVESRPKEEKIFLMTDEAKVQTAFLKEFGEDKVVIYDKINATIAKDKVVKLPDDHRFTSLEHTFIDVLIAAHARHFMMAPYSSLSELVRVFEAIGKQQLGWCSPGQGYY